ncbi:hypothetical protein [Pseudarthrobacter equi]|nr:hypothetical protein [Pseudarthrobacter equi]
MKMSQTPIDEFLAGEANDYIRAQLLTIIEQRQAGRQYLTYNTFNVLLDVDAGTAIVEDELDVDRQSVVSLSHFETLLRSAD